MKSWMFELFHGGAKDQKWLYANKYTLLFFIDSYSVPYLFIEKKEQTKTSVRVIFIKYFKNFKKCLQC